MVKKQTTIQLNSIRNEAYVSIIRPAENTENKRGISRQKLNDNSFEI